MHDGQKTKAQLIAELAELRQRVAELESADIARRKVEEALRQSRKELQLTLEATTDGIWTWNFQSNELSFSPQYYRMLGYQPNEFPASFESWQAHIHLDDLENALKVAGQWLQTKSSKYENEFRLKTKTGEYRWVHTSGKVIERDESGEAIRMIGNHEDITARKQVEQALRESEQRFREIAETIQDVFWMSAPKSSKVLYISPAYEKVWQHPRQDLYENPRLWMDSIHPEDVGIVRANWVRQIQGEYTYEEFRIVRPNGTIRWIANHAYPIISNDGHVHRITGIAQDITDRKQAQAQLQTALAEKETLLLELYHRTKNNMQVICAILDLQTAYIDDERVLQVFAETTNRIQSMALVHQKLYQSQDLSRIDLREYITELAEFLLASYQVSPTRIKLALDLETVFVLIDTAIPCGLILNELISNALKYAFPGDRKGEIRIQLLKTASDEIELQVADNGVGGAPGFDFREDGRFGLKTIFSLGEQQLQGHVRFEVNNGVVCRLEFKDNLYKPRV